MRPHWRGARGLDGRAWRGGMLAHPQWWRWLRFAAWQISESRPWAFCYRRRPEFGIVETILFVGIEANVFHWEWRGQRRKCGGPSTTAAKFAASGRDDDSVWWADRLRSG